MNIPLAAWLWLILSVSCYGVGEYFSKEIAVEFSWRTLSFLLLGYLGSTIFWIPAMIQKNSLIILGVIWTLLVSIITISIGIYTGEVITPVQWVGVALAVIGAILLSL